MKASVVNEIGGGFGVEELELAVPAGREVLVDIKASGLCHSDLTLANAGLGYPLPSVFGHELAGVVAAVGPDVTEFRIGDHVVGSLIQFCGKCAHCLSGNTHKCLHPEATLRSESDAPRLTKQGKAMTGRRDSGHHGRRRRWPERGQRREDRRCWADYRD